MFGKWTTERKEKFKQSQVGWLIFGGAVLFFCSGVGVWVLSMSSVFHATSTRTSTGAITSMGDGVLIPAAVTLMTIGIGAVVWGYVASIRFDRGKNFGARTSIPDARILARFGIDRNGRYVPDDGSLEFQDDVRYHVQALSPMHGTIEYECSPETFYTIGEGMIGTLEVQGRWIGSFQTYLGAENTHVGRSF